MVATLAQAHEMIAAQAAQITVLEGSLKKALATIDKQQHQLEQLLKRLYGRKSETYHPDQLMLDSLLLQALPDPATAAPPTPPYELPPPPSRPRRTRGKHGRLPIPDHLERRVIELDVDETARFCPRTGAPLMLIGHEETEKLEYQPGRLFVNVYRRAKYAAADRRAGHHAGVVTAPMPDHPIARCKADPGLIAYAIVSKFADHLPFYRQDAIFEREGVHIPRSTLDGWVLQTADALKLLGVQLKKAVLDTEVLFTDDSVIPLLETGRGKTRPARLWVCPRRPRPAAGGL